MGKSKQTQPENIQSKQPPSIVVSAWRPFDTLNSIAAFAQFFINPENGYLTAVINQLKKSIREDHELSAIERNAILKTIQSAENKISSYSENFKPGNTGKILSIILEKGKAGFFSGLIFNLSEQINEQPQPPLFEVSREVTPSTNGTRTKTDPKRIDGRLLKKKWFISLIDAALESGDWTLNSLKDVPYLRKTTTDNNGDTIPGTIDEIKKMLGIFKHLRQEAIKPHVKDIIFQRTGDTIKIYSESDPESQKSKEPSIDLKKSQKERVPNATIEKINDTVKTNPKDEFKSQISNRLSLAAIRLLAKDNILALDRNKEFSKNAIDGGEKVGFLGRRALAHLNNRNMQNPGLLSFIAFIVAHWLLSRSLVSLVKSIPSNKLDDYIKKTVPEPEVVHKAHQTDEELAPKRAPPVLPSVEAKNTQASEAIPANEKADIQKEEVASTLPQEQKKKKKNVFKKFAKSFKSLSGRMGLK